jgi:hypothetical protein
MIILPPESVGSYYDQLKCVTFYTLLSNVGYYLILPFDFFSDAINLSFSIIGVTLYIITIPFFYFGIVKKFRENYLYIIFSFFLIIMLIILPFIQGLRYIFPILPFYLFFLFVGLNEKNYFLQFHCMKKYYNLNFMLLFGLTIIFVFCVTVSSRTIHTMINKLETIDGPYTKESVGLFDYISKHTNNEDVIIFYKPRVLSLYTDRRAVALSDIKSIMASKASYIACKKNDEVDNILRNSKLSRNKIFRNSTFNLYRK